MYAIFAIIGIIALVALWWVTTAAPLRRALREMGGRTSLFTLGYLGGHPKLSLRSPLTMCSLFLTPQGLLIHTLGQFAPIRFENLAEAAEDVWQGPSWREPPLPDARGKVADRRVPVLRISFTGDRGFADAALFVCQEPDARTVARQIMEARAVWERADKG